MKKKIAPIIVTIIVGFFMLVYLGVILIASFSSKQKFDMYVYVILGLIATGILTSIIILIITLLKRLKEIEDEDNDDLSKY